MASEQRSRATAWLFDHLACPRDGESVDREGSDVICRHGHRYPVVDNVPVMIRDDVPQTLWVADRSLRQARGLEKLDASGESEGDVDGFVQGIVAATCGYMYRPSAGALNRYPIPTIRLPAGADEPLLDVGCNWGRWSIAAGRRGYIPVGIDPSLDAVLAAKRVARQLGVDAAFVVGDARFLPFSDQAFSVIFSYSVLQHFAKPDCVTALRSIRRVLKTDGMAMIQMPNRYGIRSLYHLARRRFREGEVFDVRYWTPTELKTVFSREVGPATLSVDGFFGLGIQGTDSDLLPARFRLVVATSEILRRITTVVSPLAGVADSLYVRAIRQASSANAEA